MKFLIVDFIAVIVLVIIALNQAQNATLTISLSNLYFLLAIIFAVFGGVVAFLIGKLYQTSKPDIDLD